MNRFFLSICSHKKRKVYDAPTLRLIRIIKYVRSNQAKHLEKSALMLTNPLPSTQKIFMECLIGGRDSKAQSSFRLPVPSRPLFFSQPCSRNLVVFAISLCHPPSSFLARSYCLDVGLPTYPMIMFCRGQDFFFNPCPRARLKEE